MKQVIDNSGQIISDLIRNSDGSLSLNNGNAYNKNKLQHDNFNRLTTEIEQLREQMKIILEKLNG